jgi:hypothetical protein
MEERKEYTSDPKTPGFSWGSVKDCIEIDDLESGQDYYVRTVTVGDWVKKRVP